MLDIPYRPWIVEMIFQREGLVVHLNLRIPHGRCSIPLDCNVRRNRRFQGYPLLESVVCETVGVLVDIAVAVTFYCVVVVVGAVCCEVSGLGVSDREEVLINFIGCVIKLPGTGTVATTGRYYIQQ
jgi:hypothetical protein